MDTKAQKTIVERMAAAKAKMTPNQQVIYTTVAEVIAREVVQDPQMAMVIVPSMLTGMSIAAAILRDGKMSVDDFQVVLVAQGALMGLGAEPEEVEDRLADKKE